MTDDDDLQRFVAAQAKVYDRALAELTAGQKSSHWMWFVFPQLAGLGRSPTAQRYSIASLEEARAYLHHPLLGERLVECTNAVLRVDGRTAEGIFGYPDCLKFCSCMTLFDRVAPQDVFARAIGKYCGGERDPLTSRMLGEAPEPRAGTSRRPAR